MHKFKQIAHSASIDLPHSSNYAAVVNTNGIQEASSLQQPSVGTINTPEDPSQSPVSELDTRAFLEANGIDIRDPNLRLELILQNLVSANLTQYCTSLLHSPSININSLSPSQQNTALHRIISIGNSNREREIRTALHVTQLLLHHGASTEALDKNGNKPIHLAAQHRNPAFLEALLEKGADIHSTDPSGRNASHIAAKATTASFASLSLLTQHGLSIDTKDHSGWTPLHIVASEDDDDYDDDELHSKKLSWIANQCSNIDETDEKGQTALCKAAKRGLAKNVRLLLSAGADPGTVNLNMQSVLLVSKKDFQRVMQEIREAQEQRQ